jgi:hypothetical protein
MSMSVWRKEKNLTQSHREHREKRNEKRTKEVRLDHGARLQERGRRLHAGVLEVRRKTEIRRADSRGHLDRGGGRISEDS